MGGFSSTMDKLMEYNDMKITIIHFYFDTL